MVLIATREIGGAAGHKPEPVSVCQLMARLEPIDPATAVELYLSDRETEVTAATLQSHRSRLRHFKQWCAQQGIENLNTVTGRQLHAYRLWRREDGDLSPASEKTQMDTIRVFIRWLESIDGVEPDLHTKVRSPQLDGDDNVRDVMLARDRAEAVLAYLAKFGYASREHVVLALMWHTMMRVGAVRALDVEDYYPETQVLEVCHRPESETPLKNKERGERVVALADEVCEVLDDWLAHKRPDVTDTYGREPLIASPQGRVHVSTLRGDCYRLTRPCEIGEACPHGRDVETCAATEYMAAFACPSSVSPHAVRRGGITYALTREWPAHAVSDRANVSEAVLDAHYDQRSEWEKVEQRRQYLENL